MDIDDLCKMVRAIDEKLDLLVISVTRHDEKIRFASWLSGAAFLAALGVIAGVAKQWLSP